MYVHAVETRTMLQGDPDWWRLAETISNEDRTSAIEHNAHAEPEYRLYDSLGPVPCVGAIMTAPIVLLLSHPALDGRTPRRRRELRNAGTTVFPRSSISSALNTCRTRWLQCS